MENPIVQVRQGQLRGIKERNVNGKVFVAFRGVPYATSPVGKLRFKDCEPLEPWFGVRDAIEFGDRCAQQELFTSKVVGSDDCLNLNIYTSTLYPPVPRAVMVWMHGGMFVWGSSRDELYGPDYLIEKDVVLVTMNYRLGILGFLNADHEEAPGNQGLKDQVQALKWIQQNIAKFGGDPNNVTICGDSAGSASVHYLSISRLAQGLFHKAIMHSGVAVNPWAYTPIPPMESVRKLATVLNKDIGDVKEFIEYLRTVSTDRLVEAAIEMETQQDKILFIHPFIPTVDSKAKNPFSTIPPEEAIKEGIKVPCICGHTSLEGMVALGVMNADTYNAIDADPDNLLIHPTVLQFLKKRNVSVDDMKSIYFGDEKISIKNKDKMAKLLTDIYFIIGLHRTMQIQSQILNAPMYFYKFEYEVEISLLKKFYDNTRVKGTCHGDELAFLFYQKIGKLMGKKVPAPGSVEHRLIQRFTDLWTNFAKTGNPTPQSSPQLPIEWEPIDNTNEYKYLHITDKLTMNTDINIMHRLSNE